VATQGLAFYLWIEVVVILSFVADVIDVVVVVDVVVDVVDVLDINIVIDWVLDILVVNICLRKPNDSKIFVYDHGANKKVVEEDPHTTFDANVPTVIADVCAAPVERAIIS